MNIPSHKLLLKDKRKGIGWYVVNIATLIFCIKDNQLNVLLEKRVISPEKNKWILPAKFLNYNFSPEQIAEKKLNEVIGKTDAYLEQLYLFGDPNKKLGKRVVTSAYMLLIPNGTFNKKPSKSQEISWFPVSNLPALAFDSKRIIEYGVKRLKNKTSHTNIIFGLLPERFRLSELQRATEIVLDTELNKRNFRTKILSSGILKPTGQKELKGAHRPAMLYQFKSRELRNIN